MEQLRRRRREEIQSPSPLPGRGPDDAALPGPASGVLVTYGPSQETLELEGLTVMQAFELLRQPFHVAPEANVIVNGRPASPDQQLVRGDSLEFVRLSGEKGAH
jgi:hypothetical protein